MKRFFKTRTTLGDIQRILICKGTQFSRTDTDTINWRSYGQHNGSPDRMTDFSDIYNDGNSVLLWLVAGFSIMCIILEGRRVSREVCLEEHENHHPNSSKTPWRHPQKDIHDISKMSPNVFLVYIIYRSFWVSLLYLCRN